MAKGKGPTTASPVMSKMPPPTVRMDIPTGTAMPTVGDKITVEFSGKVVSTEAGINRYGDGKQRASIEIEHDLKSIKIEPEDASEVSEMSDEQKADLKKKNPTKWRQYLGGPK